MKRVLITGSSGFVGGHLIDHLLSLGDNDIYGTYRSEKPKGEGDHLHFKQVDLEKKEEVDALLDEVRPDRIYHLAAQSNVDQSIKNPIATFHTNIDSQLNLLTSLKEKDMGETRILLVSSAEVYGFVTSSDLPVDEDTPYKPGNPYAVSKIAQDYIGFQYFLSYKLPLIRVRPFSHVGPRQSPAFVVANFAKQIALIEKGGEKVIKVGNLEAKRDFTDVRDMVKLYAMLIEKGIPGEVYNAGKGEARSIQEILDTLLSFATVSITVEKDPSRMRPSDLPILVADPRKVKEITGWEPAIPLQDTLKDTLEYWRQVY